MIRHDDWKRVEPGTPIPAGQPYRLEYTDDSASDHPHHPDLVAGDPLYGEPDADWFVDSSWRPPLELPTEPTWGIPIQRFATGATMVHKQARWYLDPDDQTMLGQLPVADLLDFIPLTDDQVARIEAAR
jgi:hypothetical protein